MQAKHYVVIALLGGVWVVFVLSGRGCSSVTSLFRGKPEARYSSGRRVPLENIETPLKANVGVAQQRGTVVFTFQLRDAAGVTIESLNLPTGRPRAPRVEVFDADGDRVYKCTLEYG